MVCLTKDEIT